MGGPGVGADFGIEGGSSTSMIGLPRIDGRLITRNGRGFRISVSLAPLSPLLERRSLFCFAPAGGAGVGPLM